MDFTTLSTNTELAFILTLIGLVLTIFGSIASFYGIKSYRDQKKVEGSYNEILERANTDWEGKYTKQELESMKLHVEKLTKEIANEIPNQAKSAIVEHQLRNIIKEIYDLYQEYLRLKKQLNSFEEVNLDKNIEAVIKSEISVQYGSQKKNPAIVVLILIGIFLSMPLGNEMVYWFLRDIIHVTGANVSLVHITSYTMFLIVITYIVYVSNIKRLNRLADNSKKKAFALSVSLLTLWATVLYCVSYDVIFKDYLQQIILGIISIFAFAIGVKSFGILMRRR